MTQDKFAVLCRRERDKSAVMSEPTLEELMDEIGSWNRSVPGADFLLVEYQRSGYIELARADTVSKLEQKVKHKTGAK